MNQRRSFTIFSGLSLAIGITCYLVGRARADGIPTTPMVYSGFLEDGAGNPVNGTKPMVVELFKDQTDTTAVCTTNPGSVAVTNGRFQVPLAGGCTDAVHANPDLWVRFTVDGNQLPHSKLGVVPYALQAGKASAAVGALDTRIGAVETSVAAMKMGFGAVADYNGAPNCCVSWSDTGQKLSLPSAGTYLVFYTAAGSRASGTRGDASLVKLVASDSESPWTLLSGTFAYTANATSGSVSLIHLFTVSAPDDVKVFVRDQFGGAVGLFNARLGYVRLP